jgi:LysM repeat protein
MHLRSRAVVLAALGVGPVLLVSACGSSTPEGATTTTTTTLAGTGSEGGGIAPNEQIYVIQAGDSISRIASIHGITSDQLISYNEWADGLAHFLGIGDQVRIPPGSKIPGATSASTDETTTGGDTGDTGDTGGATETTPGAGCTHTIAAGEFPNRVANQYDITVEQLIAANPGGVMDTFLIGATLQIPAGASC